MNYFNDKNNVEDYIKMAEGYDGKALIEILKKHLPPASTVLELGMGPGTDLEILAQDFTVTGSDYSPVFIERYQAKNPKADLVLLNAVTMNTERKFDCIYSNKVLHHLTKKELKQSLNNQLKALNNNGLLFHTFWYGTEEKEISGLQFIYYTEKMLTEFISPQYKIIALERYTEMEEDDSIYVILKPKIKT